jgi:hypothetical protein
MKSLAISDEKHDLHAISAARSRRRKRESREQRLLLARCVVVGCLTD